MKLSLDAVQLDTSIQCRAAIDTAVVNEYAERMEAGDTFPPIEVFGAKSKCWIGDGWHRVMAALQRGAASIDAHLGPGGRADALKYALGANALHGHRRTNADKRRCVEIALREFPKLSSRAVAKMCGVGKDMVEGARPQVAENATSERTGQDGKQYPAHRDLGDLLGGPPMEPPTILAGIAYGATGSRPKLGPPSNGMQFARMALMDLEQIRDDDVERDAAFSCVQRWLSEHSKGEI